MRVDFYHLQKSSIEQVVLVLVEKAYATGKRLLIKTELIEKARYLDNLLWGYDPDSWLPHGSNGEGNEQDQPILITTQDMNLNQAEMIMLVDGGDIEEIRSYERCFNLFDGHDENAVQNARNLWKEVIAAGFEAYYWQQNDHGKWEMKASKVSEK